MVHFLIGSIATAVFILVVLSARRKNLHVRWWQWILTVLCFFYAIFVLEVIVSFLEEGAGRAALVMGIALGFVSVVWAVLLGRVVFTRKAE
jgi:hypothetical protein